jgi:RNA polymerase sigma-70 factor (ECF subfamily)
LFIYKLSGDKHIAEDIMSETFMKAIKSIDSFKGNCDIRVWLFQIAKNSYFSHLRKTKKLVDIDVLSEQKSDIDVEYIISSSEEAMMIHKILHNLKEPYKEVFSLRVFGELSFKQIAYLFGKSDNWACVTYHRAKNMLKEQMEGFK